MFMERLRRSQGNVLLGLFNTGVKMLGLGVDEIQKDKTTEILKLLVSEGKATSRGNGPYNKVSSLPLFSFLCLSVFLSQYPTFCLSFSVTLLPFSSPFCPRCCFLGSSLAFSLVYLYPLLLNFSSHSLVKILLTSLSVLRMFRSQLLTIHFLPSSGIQSFIPIISLLYFIWRFRIIKLYCSDCSRSAARLFPCGLIGHSMVCKSNWK